MARILIIDDDEEARVLCESVLSGAGHEVVASPSADAAFKGSLDGSLDLVITDLLMPDLHGFELIEMLRELDDGPLVIALSGTGESQLNWARHIGAAAAVGKPIDPAQLVQVVEKALAARGTSS